MNFTFQISAYSKVELEEQLAKALGKRTGILSRRRLPRLWKFADWLGKFPKVSEQVLRRRRVANKIYGIVLLALGIFVLAPGLMAPRVASLIIAGVICIALGILFLFPWRKKEDKRYQRGAALLLTDLENIEMDEEMPIEVTFDGEGMKIGEETVIPYSNFNAMVETERLYLFTWKEQVTVLQKKDLVVGAPLEFVKFLEEQTGLTIERTAYCGNEANE